MAFNSDSRACLAVALATGAALAVAPAFVTPLGNSANPSLRVSGQPAQRLSSSRAADTASFALVGASAAAAVVAVAGKHAKTTAKNFVDDYLDIGRFSGAAYRPFDPATERGAQSPLGFWDPLGLSNDKDKAAFKRRRAVEIKHGRIAMYATIGYIVPEYYKFPGFLSPSLGLKFADVPNGLAALSKVPLLGWVQIIWFIGLIEGSGFFSGRLGFGFRKDVTEEDEPGNYGVGFPTFLGKVEDMGSRDNKLSAELANGRLAMMAIIGMFFQDGLTGSAWGDWSLYTASPLRAAADGAPPPPPSFNPASQVGALAPLGFFDPAGFSKVGDKAGFQNLRAAEIKHGRVAMMAALGGVIQHYVKFPGFESVPAGLGAVTAAPGTYGFIALFVISGVMELAIWTQDANKEAGNFGDPVGLGQYNEEMRNKEINNGRFAMFAALGIAAADLATGKDAIQQFGL
jgi:light-harvesting complex I chlorophyll a/b binding protein 1